MRNSFIYFLITVAVIAIFFTVFQPSYGPQELAIGNVIELAKQGKLAKIEVSRDDLIVVTTGGDTFRSRKESGSSMMEILQQAGVSPGEQGMDLSVKGSTGLSNLFGVLINFLPLIFFGALLLFMMRQAQGSGSQTMNFGRSKARVFIGNRPAVAFSDVAGADEAKEELEEIVQFLRFPERFAALGARVPRGVLLMGPPGTGKTLLARAVAGEAAVPFFSISGSEFVEMFVGVGASRVRDLFDQAKRNAPCIIFVDEIDAVGRHRGAGLGGGHDEREQTLNQILVEMDGFDTGTNIIVIAATNRPDILDPALLRPGRFDRRVTLDLPDIKGRLAILDVHVKGKPLDPEVDLNTVAKEASGFSGADLANLVNEAAILAARRGKKAFGQDEFAESIDRLLMGPERRSRVISKHEKELTAYHEAGHALVAKLLPHSDPVHKITIVSRGASGGHTRYLPDEDRHLWTKRQFEDMLAAAMGGRVAEEITFDEVTTGASNDLEQATSVARQMVTRFGMSDKLGPRTFGKREELVFLGREISEQRDYSDRVAEEIDEEVHSLVDTAYHRARETLEANKPRLGQIAELLLEHETLEAAGFAHVFDAAPPAAEDEPPTATPEDAPSDASDGATPATPRRRRTTRRSAGPGPAPAPAA